HAAPIAGAITAAGPAFTGSDALGAPGSFSRSGLVAGRRSEEVVIGQVGHDDLRGLVFGTDSIGSVCRRTRVGSVVEVWIGPIGTLSASLLDRVRTDLLCRVLVGRLRLAEVAAIAGWGRLFSLLVVGGPGALRGPAGFPELLVVDLRLVDLASADDGGDFLRARPTLTGGRAVVASPIVQRWARGSLALIAAASAVSATAEASDVADVDACLNAEDVVDRAGQLGRVIALLESLHGSGIVEPEVDHTVGERLRDRVGGDDRTREAAALLHGGQNARPGTTDRFDLSADVSGPRHRGGLGSCPRLGLRGRLGRRRRLRCRRRLRSILTAPGVGRTRLGCGGIRGTFTTIPFSSGSLGPRLLGRAALRFVRVRGRRLLVTVPRRRRRPGCRLLGRRSGFGLLRRRGRFLGSGGSGRLGRFVEHRLSGDGHSRDVVEVTIAGRGLVRVRGRSEGDASE